MTSDVATTTGLAEWRPNVGSLPAGWVIVNVEVHIDRPEWGSRRESMTALVTLRYAPFGPRLYHEVRLRLAKRTGPVEAWLTPFLEALSKVTYPTYADIDCEGRRYP